MVQYFMQSSFHISLYLCILVCILEIALHIAMTSINLQYPILVSVLDGAITSLLCFPLFYFGLQFFLELKQDKLKIQELALQNQNSILEAQYIALQNQNISLQEKNLALQNQNASLQKQEQELKFKEIEEKNQEVYKLINQCEKEKNMLNSIFFFSSDLKNVFASINGFLGKIIPLMNKPGYDMDRSVIHLQNFKAVLKELSQNNWHVNKLVENIAEISQKVYEISQQSTQSLKSSQDALQNIQKSSSTITQKILDLEEKSREIESILEIMKNIVDKTDILALNASLEGTKAGEAGKGFLVLAKEMRRLSERASDSTMQVKDMLEEIQNAIHDSVIATEEGGKCTISGILVIEKTVKDFESIFYTIKAIQDASSQISLVTQQQNATTEQTIKNINEFSGMVKENMVSIKEILNSLSELNESVQKAKNQVDNLCNLTSRKE